ncbi:hypothetical protein ACHQM5_014417 [Ranunculus cassubicifolius]
MNTLNLITEVLKSHNRYGWRCKSLYHLTNSWHSNDLPFFVHPNPNSVAPVIKNYTTSFHHNYCINKTILSLNLSCRIIPIQSNQLRPRTFPYKNFAQNSSKKKHQKIS